MNLNPYSVGRWMEMRSRVWDTRDNCWDHYPRRCPDGCPYGGKHDAELAVMNLCECRHCKEPS